MLRVVVLGTAAGGGIPQWNCGCQVCSSARSADPQLQSTQASLAVSVDDRNWFLINASPDLRQQLTHTPQLHPEPGRLRHTPIAGVILTNGEIDAVAGLLSMREGSPFTIYAHAKVLQILKANSIFNVLNEKNVKRETIVIDQSFEPRLTDGSASGIEILPFAVSGKTAWYLEGESDAALDDTTGDTIGLRIDDKTSGMFFYFIAACVRVTPDLKDRLAGAPLIFFDGTLWRDDELVAAGLGTRTGLDMGHISMSGEDGAIAAFAELGIGRKIFLHINNSNPALLHHSPERATVTAAGWHIPTDGTEITL